MPGFDPNEKRDAFGRWTDEISGAIRSAASDKHFVLDEQGKPQVFYHGTKNKFDVFSKEKIGSNFEDYSFGFHFASTPGSARQYVGGEGELKQVFLSIQNPLKIDAGNWGAEAFLDERRNEIISKVVESRRNKKPYDGVIVTGVYGQKSVVVFEPNQIHIIK